MQDKFDLLEGVVEEEQNTFKRLVRKEIDERKRIKVANNAYLGTGRKQSS